MSPKYRVTVARTERRVHEFLVEASGVEEAEDKATEAACDYDFANASMPWSNEEVVSVSEVRPDNIEAEK